MALANSNFIGRDRRQGGREFVQLTFLCSAHGTTSWVNYCRKKGEDNRKEKKTDLNVSFSVLAHSIHEEPPKQLIWTPYTVVMNWCLTLLDLDLNINNADSIDLDLCLHVTFAISILKKKERKFICNFPFMKNHTIQCYTNTWKKMNVMHNPQSYCSSVLLLDLDLNKKCCKQHNKPIVRFPLTLIFAKMPKVFAPK